MVAELESAFSHCLSLKGAKGGSGRKSKGFLQSIAASAELHAVPLICVCLGPYAF